MTINANGIGTSSSMRGINHDVNVSGENGTIQYYVNDVPVSSNFVLQAMYDIGQVSVERGPQGTLRGRSTPSGSIDINWKKPSLTEVGAAIQGSAGGGSSTSHDDVLHGWRDEAGIPWATDLGPEFAEGERLPALRNLARRARVSPASMLRALPTRTSLQKVRLPHRSRRAGAGCAPARL